MTIYDTISQRYSVKLEEVLKDLSTNSNPSVEKNAANLQQAKYSLALIYRLARMDSFKQVLRLNRHERSSKLIDYLSKVLKSTHLFGKLEMLEKDGISDKVKFVYISNMLELVYKSLILFLYYQQRMISKRAKYTHNLGEIERRMKEMDTIENTQQFNVIKQKLTGLAAKYKDLNHN